MDRKIWILIGWIVRQLRRVDFQGSGPLRLLLLRMNLQIILSLISSGIFAARINTVFVTQTATATATATALVAPSPASATNSTTPSSILDAVKGTVPAGNSTCKYNMDKATEIGMSSWWHCEGPAASCLAQALLDVQQNLNSVNCSKFDCFPPHTPSNIDVLRELGKKYWPEESKTDGLGPEHTTCFFTPYMELLANILVQKSRFCRMDIDVAAHLAELVAASLPCTSCLNNSTLAQNTTSTNSTVSEQRIFITSAVTMVSTITSQRTITPS